MRVRPAQIALVAVVTAGFGLLGASAHGMIGIDERLQTAGRPEIRTIDVVERDCPARERPRPEI